MIKEKYVLIKGHPRNIKYYSELGYDIQVRKEIQILTTHLMSGSSVNITTICSNCSNESNNTFKDYWLYTNGLVNPFYCIKCKTIKSEKTCLDKYGVSNPMKNEEIKNKLKQTNLDKYLVKNTKIFRERNTWQKFYKLLDDEYEIVSYKDEFFNINHTKCGSNFEISKSLLSARYKLKNILCTKCNPIGVHFSSIEIEVTNFLDEYGIEYVHGDRTTLNGKELDIYIPKYNLALEINGLFWHSELYKGQKYHLIKTLLCRDKNIHLIHIWEDDWKLKSNILKSIILNKIGLLDNKIWARKCIISDVSSSDARKFLDENHIQGFSSSSIKLGLYYNEELVSLMTFGWRMTNGKKEYELIRFCNKINYIINGSSSKLFKYFINNYQIDEIISYSDVSMFDGNMYDMLGFEKVSISKPNYFWVVNSVRRHRYNFSKKKLVSKGHDINKTEVEIMTELGHYRIFSCGQEKWIYKNKNPLN